MLQLQIITFLFLSSTAIWANPVPAAGTSLPVPEGSPASVTVLGWARPDTALFSVSSLSFIDLATATPSAVKIGPSLTYMEAGTKPTGDSKQKLANYAIVGSALYVEGVAKVGPNGARQPIQVLNCKVADGGAGNCKLIEYAQKKGHATPITTHSATVTLTSTTIQASQLTKISPAAKAEINKAKKANE